MRSRSPTSRSRFVPCIIIQAAAAEGEFEVSFLLPRSPFVGIVTQMSDMRQKRRGRKRRGPPSLFNPGAFLSPNLSLPTHQRRDSHDKKEADSANCALERTGSQLDCSGFAACGDLIISCRQLGAKEILTHVRTRVDSCMTACSKGLLHSAKGRLRAETNVCSNRRSRIV